MGGPHRRRETKQRLRALETGAAHIPTMGALLRFMALSLVSEDLEWSEPVLLALDRMPPAFADALDGELAAQRAKMRARGWTDVAIGDLERNLLWTPPTASSLERDLRLLALLVSSAPGRSVSSA